MNVTQLREDLSKAHEGLDGYLKDLEGKEWSQEQRDEVGRRMGELKDLKGRLDKAAEDSRLASEVEDMLGALGDLKGPEAERRARNGEGKSRNGDGKSLGERFVESAAFKDWHAGLATASGQIPESTKGISSPPFHFAGFKELITGLSDTSAGALVFPDRAPMLDLLRRELTVRDIVTNGRTGSDTVEYVRVVSQTNAAAPVAEATATAGTGVKPESGMTFARETATVRTIAHWIPATKRALADAAQVRTLVDAFLRYGLEEELEDQMVNGAGTGENFTGISNVAGVQAQAWDTDILVTTRRARTKVSTVGRVTPSAYLLNPTDWETIELTRDNNGNFYFGGPAGPAGQNRLWGLPVVLSEAVTVGVGYVADFRQAILWDREQASIQVSDSHNDFFTRNMVAILAEMRAAFGVLRPTAFVEIDLTAV